MMRLKGEQVSVATILTEVVVDRSDPGFLNPTKPDGPFYEAFRARDLEMEKGWIMKEDAGRGWRRLVPSPKPLRIVQGELIANLVNQGRVVIACGGGGIPVVEDRSGYLVGVEAVIDKDRTSALLAHEIGAEILIILTEVEQVALNFGQSEQENLSFLSLEEAKRHLEEGQFPPGSMGPKIESAINFIEAGGQEVIITTAEVLLRGDVKGVGTRIGRE